MSSPTTRAALQMGALFLLARAATVVVQIAAGRTLGRYEFGLANLIIAAAAYLQIAVMLGFHTAMSHFVAQAQTDEARRRVLSTILAAFIVWAALAALLFHPLRPGLSRLFGVPVALMSEAAVLALATTLHTVLASILLGLRQFNRRGFFEALYGLGAGALFLALIQRPGTGHGSLIAAMAGALFVSSACMFAFVAPLLTVRLRAGLLPSALAYAATASVNVLASASVVAPARLAANAGLGVDAVATVSAYFVVSIQPALALVTVFSSFLLPYASTPEGFQKSAAFLREYWIAAAIGLTSLFFMTSAVGLTFFGPHYTARPAWSALFALAATASVAHFAASAMLAARGLRSLQISVAGTLISAAVNTLLAFPLVQRHGAPGAAAALLLGFACSLVFFAWVLGAGQRAARQKTIMALE